MEPYSYNYYNNNKINNNENKRKINFLKEKDEEIKNQK
jgi:hypothetical protein